MTPNVEYLAEREKRWAEDRIEASAVRAERQHMQGLFRSLRMEMAEEMAVRVQQEVAKIRSLRDATGKPVHDSMKTALLMALHSSFDANPKIAMSGRKMYLETLEKALRRKLNRDWRKAAYGTTGPDRPTHTLM